METISEDTLSKSKPVGFVDVTAGGAKAPGEKSEQEINDLLDKAGQALSEINGAYAEEDSSANDGRVTVDVGKAVEGSGILKTAADRVDDKIVSNIRMNPAERMAYDSVSEITEDDKTAFVEAIATGGRYKVTTSLFGGRVKLVLRSRSTGEGEAIDSYVRRKIAGGSISNGSEYGDVVRLCLLVAGVERVGDETFPEMKEPLLPVVTGKDEVEEPGWVGMLDVWRAKPEGLVNAVLRELFSFEAKYNEMVSRGSDENFWLPAESTGA